MTPFRRVFLYTLVTLLATGCTEGDDEKRPPQITLSVVNAAPEFGNLTIRRGTTQAAAIGTLRYADRTTVQFDSGPYNFTVETGSSQTSNVVERATFSEDLVADEKHLIVLAQQNGAVLPLRFSRPVFDPDAPDWEIHVVNAAEPFAQVDVYAVPAGTPIAGATAIGPVAFAATIDGGTRSPGEYEFIVTEAGNSAAVLFTSDSIELTAGLSVELTVVTSMHGTDGALTVLGSTLQSAFTLNDVDTPATARISNGAADQLARDVYLDGDFAAAFAANVEFATVGDFASLPNDTDVIAVTPAGNPSVVEAEVSDSIQIAAAHDILIAGGAGDVSVVAAPDNRLRNLEQGRLRILNTVNDYETLNVFVTEPGTDITTVSANVVFAAPAASERSAVAAGTHALSVTDAATGTVVLGPLDIAIAAGGLYTVLLHDSGDGTTVSAALLDDF